MRKAGVARAGHIERLPVLPPHTRYLKWKWSRVISQLQLPTSLFRGYQSKVPIEQTLRWKYIPRFSILLEVTWFSNLRAYVIVLAKLTKSLFPRNYKVCIYFAHGTSRNQIIRILIFLDVMPFSNLVAYLIALAELTKWLFHRNSKSLGLVK